MTDAEFLHFVAYHFVAYHMPHSKNEQRLREIADRLVSDKWQPISIADKYPLEHERVLFFDARDGEWFVGWNAYRHTVGGLSRPGSWAMPCGDTDGMHITHWKPLPKGPK